MRTVQENRTEFETTAQPIVSPDPSVSVPPSASVPPSVSVPPSATPAPGGSAAPSATPAPSGSAAPSASASPPGQTGEIEQTGAEESEEALEALGTEAGTVVQVVPVETLAAFGAGAGAMLVLALLAAGAAALLKRVRQRPRLRTVEPAARQEDGAWTLQTACLHEQGARGSQQDSYALSPQGLWAERGALAIVADGMGGLSGGDRVSQTAVAAALEEFSRAGGEPAQVLLQCLARANAAVNRLLGPEGLGRSGTTLVAGLIQEGRFTFVSVGDSRVALLRGGALVPLNREHAYRSELALNAVNGAGTIQEALTHQKAGGLTSFLGMGRLKHLDLPAQSLRLQSGDRLILMSDGVYNALTEEELCSALGLPAEQAAEALRRRIQEKNYPTQDNYTAILLEMRPSGQA